MPAIDPNHVYTITATFDVAPLRDAPAAAAIERALNASAGALGTRISARARITNVDETLGSKTTVVSVWRTLTADALVELMRDKLQQLTERSGWTVTAAPWSSLDGALVRWAAGDFARTRTRDGTQLGVVDPATPGDVIPPTIGDRIMQGLAAAGRSLGEGVGGAARATIGGIGGGVGGGIADTLNSLFVGSLPALVIVGGAAWLASETWGPRSKRSKGKK